MANVNSPFGLKPVSHLQGLDWSMAGNWYYVPATDSTAIFFGDAVTHGGTGSTNGQYATCAQAAAAGVLLGVAVAFRTDEPFSQPATLAGSDDIPRDEYRVASVATYVFVLDDPYVLYEMQEDSDSENLAITAIGNNCDIVVGTGSTTTALSAMEIDSSSKVATTAQVRIHRVVREEDGSNALGANCKWYVTINESFYKSTVGV